MGHLKAVKIVEPIQLLMETIDKKWIPIYEQSGIVDEGTENCNLCRKYHVSHTKLVIAEEHALCHSLCPIKRFTGMDGCCFTPYQKFHHYDYALKVHTDDPQSDSITLHQIRLLRKVEALNFLRFLISLVPTRLRRDRWGMYYNNDIRVLNEIRSKVFSERLQNKNKRTR
jgi:hypothetical protein